MRLIILIAVALLVFILVKEFLKGARKRPPVVPPPRRRHETMVRCEVCSLHIPETEAFRSNEKYFCSNKHLEEYARTRAK